MAYNINKADGSILASIADQAVDVTSSSLTLVGRFYEGYGEFQNENFIWLLENFSSAVAPNNPLEGQLWWDNANNVMKAYDGNRFKIISGAEPNAAAPTDPAIGDLWWDTVNFQMKLWNGTDWTLIGPTSSSGTGLSGEVAEILTDTLGNTHPVVSRYVGNTRVSIESKDAQFTPNPLLSGFGDIRPGINLVDASVVTNAKYWGTAADSDTVGGISAGQFLRSDINTTGIGSLTIQNDTGIRIGANNDLQLGVTGNNSEIYSRTPGGNLVLGYTSTSGTANAGLTINGSSESVSTTLDMHARQYFANLNSGYNQHAFTAHPNGQTGYVDGNPSFYIKSAAQGVWSLGLWDGNDDGGGKIVISPNAEFSSRVTLTNNNDVNLTGVTGALIVGGDGTGQHIAIDGNEIMAKSNATTADTLNLQQEGGQVVIGGGSPAGLTVNGNTQIDNGWLWQTSTTARHFFDVAGHDGLGHKRITCNDGGGNFNIRADNYYGAGANRYQNTNNGAAHIRMDTESVHGNIELRVADTAITQGKAAGDTITWDSRLRIDSSGLTADPNLTVTNNASINNNLTVNNDLVIGGNLTVNGTTTTINSTTVNIDDPLITLGENAVTDTLDRGIVFKYRDSSGAQQGFIGYDRSIDTIVLAKRGTVSGNNFYYNTLAKTRMGQLVIDVPSGTAPIQFVNPTNTTKVTNLNADLLDGYHASQNPGTTGLVPVTTANITYGSESAAVGLTSTVRESLHARDSYKFDGNTSFNYYKFVGGSIALQPGNYPVPGDFVVVAMAADEWASGSTVYTPYIRVPSSSSAYKSYDGLSRYRKYLMTYTSGTIRVNWRVAAMSNTTCRVYKNGTSVHSFTIPGGTAPSSSDGNFIVYPYYDASHPNSSYATNPQYGYVDIAVDPGDNIRLGVYTGNNNGASVEAWLTVSHSIVPVDSYSSTSIYAEAGYDIPLTQYIVNYPIIYIGRGVSYRGSGTYKYDNIDDNNFDTNQAIIKPAGAIRRFLRMENVSTGYVIMNYPRDWG